MNNKAFFSSAGLAGIFLGVIVSVIGITMLPGLRIDLTEDRLYTLSDGTRNIVSNLETPIELRFFYSESATEDQPQIRAYGRRVQELLKKLDQMFQILKRVIKLLMLQLHWVLIQLTEITLQKILLKFQIILI